MVEQTVKKYPEILQMHGFYADTESQRVLFDLVVDFEADAKDIREKVLIELENLCPQMQFDIILDSDYSD